VVRIFCPTCLSESVMVWNEPSMLVVPPRNWPAHLAYPEQPIEEAQHFVCLSCDHEEHDIVALADG
jgi:hypothetical protein